MPISGSIVYVCEKGHYNFLQIDNSWPVMVCDTTSLNDHNV